MRQITDFTRGGIFKPLIQFTLPILLAQILQGMYGAVDLLVVGQFGTAADVSAVSTGSQAMHVFTNVVCGLAMGTTVLLAQKIGQKKEDEAGDVVGSGILLFGGIAVILAALLVALAAPVARLMQAPPEAFSDTVAYLRICGGGMLFIVAYNVFGGIFRGIGDGKTPLVAVAIACGVNIVGDLILCGVFGLAAKGAAIATVFAQAVSVVLSLALVKKRGLPFRFGRACIRLKKEHVLQMLKLGTPIALQDGLVGLSFSVVLAIVNTLGVAASAAVGVSEKLCMFIMLLPSSFAQSSSAFVGQNFGAGRFDRARRTLGYAIGVSLCFGVVTGLIAYFRGEWLAGIFTHDPAVISEAKEYLRSYAFDCVFVSVMFPFVGFFNGCGKTTFVMVQGIVGAFLIRIPLAYCINAFWSHSLFHIGLATPASTLVQIVMFLFAYAALCRGQRDTLPVATE